MATKSDAKKKRPNPPATSTPPAATHEPAAEWVPIADLRTWSANPRKNDGAPVAKVKASIARFGFGSPILARRADGEIIAGHTRLKAARELGLDRVPVRYLDLDPVDAHLLAIADNRTGEEAEWDDDGLASVLRELRDEDADLADTGFDADEIAALLADAAADDDADGASGQTLAERFGVPPFTILDARQGYWQDRKRAWLSIGIKSEEGRGENALGFSDVCNAGGYKNLDKAKAGAGRLTYVAGNRPVEELDEVSAKIVATQSGTSIFDPVLCELAYRWFCPPGGIILDPFAGGSVRGIVAARLGREYVGIELRAEQVAANRAQAEAICGNGVAPVWHCGDSRNARSIASGLAADFVFSCPPYADLEVYSDDPRDLSTMDYPAFVAAYREIIAAAVSLLKPNRFACFVVGDVRDPKGMYRNFPGDTIAAFEAAGARLYNEAILITAVGSLAIRAGGSFEATRKLGKAHQNVYVFCKGDPKEATQAIGKVDFGELLDAGNAQC
jgi:hypothetical protein